MSFTTASGLLPAGTAVYVQREPNGVHLETRYSVGLEGFTSQSETRQSNSLLPAWEAGSSEGLHPKQSTCGLSIRTAQEGVLGAVLAALTILSSFRYLPIHYRFSMARERRMRAER